jgi:hypothetical protein
MTAPRENDIYRWFWKEGCKPIVGCYAYLAVFSEGGLRDTYWHDWRNASNVDLGRVDLQLLGNIDECREIHRWERPYYDPADMIDMAHGNNTHAPLYLKLTATKSQESLLSHAKEKSDKARRDKEWAERAIAEWEEKINRIEGGDLEVYL